MRLSTVKLLIKVAISFFYPILLTTNVQCSSDVPAMYMRFPTDAIVELGSGHHPNYLPIVEWKRAYDPFHVVKCTAYTRDHDRCSFTLYLGEGTDQVTIDTVYQLSAKKVAIEWSETRDEAIDPLQYYTKLTTIDMDACSAITTILNVGQADTMVKFYADSIDVFSTGKYEKNVTRTRYDIYGNQKGQPANMFFDSDSFFRIFPASIELPGQGFFTFTSTDRYGKLTFVEPNGKIKQLADRLKTSKVVSGLDHSIRAICWAAVDGELDYIECAQFLDNGREMWRNRTDSSHGDEPFHVHTLGKGGVLIVSLQHHNKLQVIEMQPDAETLRSTYDADFELLTNNVRVVDFNETDRTFSIFWRSISPVANDIFLAKYSFPGKLQKDSR